MFGYGKTRHPPFPSLIVLFLNTTHTHTHTQNKGTTYSSIEGQLRKAKRIAATLPDDDSKKKSEEIMVTDDDETKDKKEARIGGDKVYPQVWAKISGRFPSSLSGFENDF